MNSGTVLAGTDGFTSITLDIRARVATGAVRWKFVTIKDAWKFPREAGGGHHVSAEPSVEVSEPHPDRVRLRFLQRAEDQTLRETRVLAGTTILGVARSGGRE